MPTTSPAPLANDPDSVPAARASQAQPQRHGPAAAFLLAGLIVLWCLLIRRFGEGNVYAVVGPYACGVSVLSLATSRHKLPRELRPTAKSIAIGLAVGAVMTLLTYPVFQLTRMVFPALDSQVQGLYHGARSTTLPKALTWVIAIIAAEELLFRGAFPHALSRWMSERNAYAFSLLCYVLAQLGTGSLIVALMALVCGTIWTVQRRMTGSLLSPLIAHLIWSPTVILLLPVT